MREETLHLMMSVGFTLQTNARCKGTRVLKCQFNPWLY